MADSQLPQENGDKRKSEEVEKQLLKVDPKVFEGVPKPKREQIIRSMVVSMHKLHIGPLPDPDTYRQYAELIPNGADRIMAMAEKQLNHRSKIEYKAITGELLQSNIGQIFAFLIGIATVGAATYCIIQGHEWPGSVLGISGMTGLVTAFIQGKKQQRRDLGNKSPNNNHRTYTQR